MMHLQNLSEEGEGSSSLVKKRQDGKAPPRNACQQVRISTRGGEDGISIRQMIVLQATMTMAVIIREDRRPGPSLE